MNTATATAPTQTGKPMRVDFAPAVLPADTLLLAGFRGSEAVSEPFLFELDLLSLKSHSIDAARLLGKAVTVTIDLSGTEKRKLHGHIGSFSHTGTDDVFKSYRAEVVSWLGLLSDYRDMRVFQDKTVREIVVEVLTDLGYNSFLADRCSRTYPKREYCVQYRESYLDFITRLLEEEGIFYFFEHEQDKHVLVLADNLSTAKACNVAPSLPPPTQYTVGMVAANSAQEGVTDLTRQASSHVKRVTSRFYDPLKPGTWDETQPAGPSGTTAHHTAYDYSDEPVYKYEGNFDQPSGIARRVGLRLDAEEAGGAMVTGRSTCKAFHAGRTFQLGAAEYALLRVVHTTTEGGYRSSSGEFTYQNDFLATPPTPKWRPARKTPKPIARGPSTARVVGASSDRVHVDSHGRVKIQFHWDRHGQEDASSSCWVRVSQNWAGSGWGGMFIPHVGHEVIVDFLEGDPDRPIITGRVYNAGRSHPRKLPDNKHKAIISDHHGHELVFDATPGEEHIRIYSPKDKLDFVHGSTAFMHVGSNVSGTIGLTVGFQAGGSISAFVGQQIGIKAASAIDFSLGPTFKLSYGSEYQIGGNDFTKHVAKKIVLNADEKYSIIGGGKDESVIEGGEKALVLRYGRNAAAEKVASQKREIAVTTVAVLAGLAGQFGAVQGWEGAKTSQWDDEGDELKHGLLGGAGVLGLAPSLIMWLVLKIKKWKASRDLLNLLKLPSLPDSQVSIDAKGVIIESGTQASVSVMGAGEVTLTAVKKIDLESGREVEVKGVKTTIEGINGVDLKSSGPVTVNGQLIKLG